jgi:hypothetical protein
LCTGLGPVSVQLGLVGWLEVRLRLGRLKLGLQDSINEKKKKLIFSVPDRDTRLGGSAELARQGRVRVSGTIFFMGGKYYIVGLLVPKTEMTSQNAPHQQCLTVSKVKGLPLVAESDSVASRIYSLQVHIDVVSCQKKLRHT